MEPFEIKVSGWKARQENAKRKMANGKTKEDREAIRAARRALYERQARSNNREMESTSESSGDAVNELEREADRKESTDESAGDQAPPTQANSEVSKRDGDEFVEVEMTREEMIAELTAAGEKVHGNTSDEKLVERVEALRNGGH